MDGPGYRLLLGDLYSGCEVEKKQRPENLEQRL